MNPPSEKATNEDLITCNGCGLQFDPSDLANVFAHEHSNQTILESGKYLGKKIEDE